MIAALAGVVAGWGVCALVLLWLEGDPQRRRFWWFRTALAAGFGLAFSRLVPLWSRWEVIFYDPLVWPVMDGGAPAWGGGLAAFVGVLAVSIWQARRLKPGTRRRPVLVAAGLGLLAAGGLGFAVEALGRGEVAKPDPGAATSWFVATATGESVALADLRGQVVVVGFWTAAEAPSRAALAEWATLARTPPPGLRVVGVVEGPEALEGPVRLPPEMPQLLDVDGRLARAFAVAERPTTVVLDPEGRVVEVRRGPVDLFWLRGLGGQYGSP